MSEPDAMQELEIIRRMIQTSRRDRAESGDIYVMWGVIVVFSTLIEAAGFHFEWPRPWLVWFVTGPLGGVLTALIISRRVRAAQVLTYAAKIEGQAWIMCGVGTAAVAFVGGGTRVIPPMLITPLICLLVAVAIGTSGAVYENKSLKWAGFGFAAIGVISMFLDRPYPQLLFVFMMIVGYILPGLAMQRKLRESPPLR